MSKWYYFICLFTFAIALFYFTHTQTDTNQMKATQSHQPRTITENITFTTFPTFKNNQLTGKVQTATQVYSFYYTPNRKNEPTAYISPLLAYHHCRVQYKLSEGQNHQHSALLIKRIDFKHCVPVPMTIAMRFNQHKHDFKEALYLSDLKFPDKVYALITGDVSQIQQVQLAEIKRLGIYHLFAISGTHIGIIAGLIYFVITRCNIPVVIAKLCVCIALPLYCLYIEWPPSAVRASSMILLYFILPKRFKRDKLSLLSFVFITFIIIQPQLMYHIGFQLSFYITFLLIFSQPAFKHASTLQRHFIISCIAQIGTLLTGIYYFNEVQWFGLFANLFFVPYYGLVVIPLTFIYFLLYSVKIPLGMFVDVLNIVYDVQQHVLSFMRTYVTIKWYVGTQSLFIYATIFLLSLLCYLCCTHKKWWYTACCAILIVSTLMFSDIYNDRLIVHTFALKKGDATLIHTPKGENILLNIGHASQNGNVQHIKYAIIPVLKKYHIRHLDAVVLSDWNDKGTHETALQILSQAVDIHDLYLPDMHKTKAMVQQLQQLGRQNMITHIGKAHYATQMNHIKLNIHAQRTENHKQNAQQHVNVSVQLRFENRKFVYTNTPQYINTHADRLNTFTDIIIYAPFKSVTPLNIEALAPFKYLVTTKPVNKVPTQSANRVKVVQQDDIIISP